LPYGGIVHASFLNANQPRAILKDMETRRLKDLRSIGKAMVEDFKLLGITEVSQLVGKDPQKLYDKLCRVTGVRHDPCVLDTFVAAVAQAENPKLPKEKCDWWYWSKIRKAKTS
jgi:hypothetical protein